MDNQQVEKMQAVRDFLKLSDIDTITISDYDNNLLIVNEKEQKRGNSPEYYIESVAEFKKLLKPYDRKVINNIIENRISNDYNNKAYNRIKNHLQGKPVIKDWLYNQNILYFLILESDTKEITETLRHAWQGLKITDSREMETVNGGEYLVLTDSEAEQVQDSELDNYLDEIVLPDLPESARSYFNCEDWKNDARQYGRGHIISKYDGREDSETINGTEYYIYRQN